MSKMLSERLKAYSGGKISSMNQLIPEDLQYDLHRLVAILAFGSPRDMIRLCKAIVDEQTRIRNEPGALDQRIIDQGIKAFSEQRSLELFGGLMEDLRKIGLASFTISKLANDIFRVTANAISRKIQIWTDQGAVVRSGEIPTPGARPQNLYSLSDPRLCLAVKSQFLVENILENDIYVCEACHSTNIFEIVNLNNCHNCQSPLNPSHSVLRAIAP